jgi:2-polyprenyl-6-methoxyphenol hydroxylase-like FAD-dependent oxidoreductase
MGNDSTAVLVVGGSLVGLSSAMFLADLKVPVVLVDPHLGSSPHPRAIGYTQRTMELFRSVGIADLIPQAPPTFRLRRRQVESLAGKWKPESDWTPGSKKDPDAAIEFSPMMGAAIAQDKVEPILREKARALGADLRLGTELVRFEQDDDGVTAYLRERDGGRESTLRASYLIACDGSQSSIREALGIGRKGRGHISTVRSVLFRAPLDEYLKSGTHQFEIEQPGLKAFLTTYNDGRWVLMFQDDIERDEQALFAAVQSAIGRKDVPIEILTTGRWDLSALVTDKFSAGRVFIAGDAAHTLPPTRGGFGANTGIQDAHNLAWKLAAVLAGASSPELLETYNAERYPVAWQRMLQTFARPDYAAHAGGIAEGVKVLDDAAMEFGQLYRSGAVLGAGEELPPAARPDEWAGQPGTRAPHLPVTKDGVAKSTLDFFGHGWALVTEGSSWNDAAASVSRKLGIEVKPVRIGEDFQVGSPEDARKAFGIGAGGASLVRPDGYVAWRVTERPENPETELLRALGTVSFAVRFR